MLAELAIVIPTLNEAGNLPATLNALRAGWPEASVVIADGGSSDETRSIAASRGARVLADLPRSRGAQMRAGANAAGEARWLLFLHADTRLDAAAIVAANAYMAKPDARFAMFRVRFDPPNLLLRFSAWWTRFDSVFTRFGDQGILVSRSAYDELGGFQTWPLFEDVDLVRRARRSRPIDVLPAAITTSSRRFQRRGVWRQQIHNASLLLRFLAGVDPSKLARNYPPADEL